VCVGVSSCLLVSVKVFHCLLVSFRGLLVSAAARPGIIDFEIQFAGSTRG